MRIIALLVALPLAAFVSQSEAKPAERVTSAGGYMRSFAASDFTGIAARGSDDIDVRVGSNFSVRAMGPRVALETLDIVRVGETLRIARKGKSGFIWGGPGRVKIYVTMPRIATAELAGSGDMTIDRVEGQAFDARSAGSGELAIAMLRVPRATLSVAGSGAISATGSVERLKASIAGSGRIGGAELRANGASISIDGSGGVKADVTGPARVSINGSGKVDLGRSARCTISTNGSGKVRCGS